MAHSSTRKPTTTSKTSTRPRGSPKPKSVTLDRASLDQEIRKTHGGKWMKQHKHLMDKLWEVLKDYLEAQLAYNRKINGVGIRNSLLLHAKLGTRRGWQMRGRMPR